MKLENFAITLEELESAIKTFINERCERKGDHFVHRDCGGR